MKNRKMLFVIHGVGYGGAGKMIVYVANAMADFGHEVILFSYDNNKCNYELNSKVTLVTNIITSKNKYQKALKSINEIRKKIIYYKPDIIISFLSDGNAYSYIASKLCKIKTPLVVCERGDPNNDNASFSKIMQLIFKNAEGAVFQTEGAQSYFKNSLGKRSVIIPNPVMKNNVVLEKFKNRRDEIVFPARFTNIQKCQDVMVKAFKSVNRKYPNMKLVFIGDGPDQEKIKNMVIEEKLERSVDFIGSIDNVLERIKLAKIFAITSDYEGIPNSLIEAMSIGMPVVSTNMSPGGAELLIENNINGLLAPIGDSKAIAESIGYFIENPDRADEIGTKAKEIENRFSDERIRQLWNNYLDKVVGND